MSNVPPNTETLVMLLDKIITTAIQDAAALNFDKSRPQHLGAVMIYISMLEMARAELTLVKSGDLIALPVLLRSIIESFGDLNQILADPDYSKNMIAALLGEKRRMLRAARNASPDHPIHSKLALAVNIDQELASVEASLQELAAVGRSAFSNTQRIGNLDAGFETVYWMLCLEGHNNVSALESRHLEHDGKGYEVVMFRGSAAEHLPSTDTLAGVVIGASQMMHKALQTGLDKHFSDLMSELIEVRQAYSSSSPD